MNFLNKINCSMYLGRYFHSSCIRIANCNRASVTKLGRKIYTRMYPTLLVRPDGSTIRFRYHEPRKIIKLPLDLNTLSAEQQKLRLSKRVPKEKIVEVEHIEVEFDPYAYIKK